MSLPKPAKLIISMFTSDKNLFDLYKEKLIKRFGEVDIESNAQPFNFTDYYEEEFGLPEEGIAAGTRWQDIPVEKASCKL